VRKLSLPFAISFEQLAIWTFILYGKWRSTESCVYDGFLISTASTRKRRFRSPHNTVPHKTYVIEGRSVFSGFTFSGESNLCNRNCYLSILCNFLSEVRYSTVFIRPVPTACNIIMRLKGYHMAYCTNDTWKIKRAF
jgi:hypothetical protein